MIAVDIMLSTDDGLRVIVTSPFCHAFYTQTYGIELANS